MESASSRSNPQFDQQLKKIRAGDVGSLNEIFEEWRPRLVLKAQQLMPDGFSKRADASDIVQETLTAAHQAVEDFCGSSQNEWRAWLYQILSNQTCRTMRFHLAERRAVSKDGAYDQEQQSRCPSPDHVLIQTERATRILCVLDKLSNKSRDVVVRRVFHRQSFEDIAVDTGQTPGAARVMWSRAIRQLRDLLVADS